MRVLVVADIHGNRAALEAVREPFDACLCAGDLVDYGPEPAWCVEWVRVNATHCVRGNHDHGAAQNVEITGAGGFRYLTGVTRPLTVAALSGDQRRFLADLPTSRMFTLGGKRFLMVHATPRDPMDEYAAADPGFWAPRLARVKADYVIVGHTHVPYTLQVGSTLVINPGSVGVSRDGNPQAAYAVIDGAALHLKRVPYAIEETVAAVDATVRDEAARLMLADIFRTGGMPTRWLRTGAPSGPANAGVPSGNGA
ncbi:MAG: metallophosphoesterase family protein [Gemmata sp.]